jgi:1-deoxy-D-xylulose-5-phosphate synthase
MNESELRNLMYTAQLDQMDQPFMIRYPRGQGVMPNWRTPVEEIKIGTGRTIREGTDIAILTFGHPGNFANDACDLLEKEGINPGLFDMRFVKPLDKNLLHHIFNKYTHVITVEDGCRIGGLGTAVTEFMAEHKYQASVHILGVPDCIVEHGKVEELYKECAYDKQGIIAAVRQMLGEKVLTTKLLNHESF